MKYPSTKSKHVMTTPGYSPGRRAGLDTVGKTDETINLSAGKSIGYKI